MRRFCQWFVIVSLILAVGGHWAFLQSVAWVSMTVNYARDASVLAALQKTFSGEHPCRLCKVVKEGKMAEQQDVPKLETKLEFLDLGASLVIYPRLVEARAQPGLPTLTPRSHSPPTPPPRFS